MSWWSAVHRQAIRALVVGSSHRTIPPGYARQSAVTNWELVLLDQYERTEEAAGQSCSSVAYYRYARLVIMCGMYSVGALAGRVGRRARTLSWLGIPLLAGGIVLTALWLIPVTTPTVHAQWADEINAEQRAAFERQRSLVNGSRREDGSWAYLLKDTSHANVALIVQASMVDSSGRRSAPRWSVRSASIEPNTARGPLGATRCRIHLRIGLPESSPTKWWLTRTASTA